MRTVLVTGGAGYIGSHIVEQLAARGDRVIMLDARVYGQPWPLIDFESYEQSTANSVSPGHGKYGKSSCLNGSFDASNFEKCDHGKISCIQGHCGDAALLDQLFSEQKIDAVIHCAALIEVGASVKEPLRFYTTNVAQTLVLLDRMKAHDIATIVFSSSAAVYGNPGVDLIPETAACMPLNPYGQSKLFIEQVLADCAQAYGLQYAALRYFNVAGAYPEKTLGERHLPETHVVPLLIRAAVEGAVFNLYSADYGTVDGTCIRDYVHVRDVARANVLALDALCNGTTNFVVNIGSGNGISVLELAKQVEIVTKRALATRVVERRAGDGARLVADATYAKEVLGWTQRYSLEESLYDAYRFHEICEYGDRFFSVTSHQKTLEQAR